MGDHRPWVNPYRKRIIASGGSNGAKEARQEEAAKRKQREEETKKQEEKTKEEKRKREEKRKKWQEESVKLSKKLMDGMIEDGGREFFYPYGDVYHRVGTVHVGELM